MAKTIFEQMGGTYTHVGDYLLPDLKLPEEETQANIGVHWRLRRTSSQSISFRRFGTSGLMKSHLTIFITGSWL